MDTSMFKLILDGKIKENEDLSQVKVRLAALFRADAARIEHLFNNSPSVIKRGLNKQEVLKYKQAIEKTGVLCRVEQEKPQPATAPKPAAASVQAKPSAKELITCPKCGFEQEGGRRECLRCGIVFAKFQPPPETQEEISHPGRKTRRKMATPEEDFEVEVLHGDREGWLSLGAGILITIIILFFPFLTFIFSYLKILVHEFGHAIFGWLFGYPTIPAFDFVYGGGGIAMHQDRRMVLLIVVYLGFCWLFYRYRRNRSTLVVLGITVLLYTLFAFTSLHNILIIFMGHGSELVFAGIFLYRAISGRGIIVAVERPLYAFVGFFIEFLDLRFAYRLITSHSYRVDYEAAKGGGHWMDFSRIAEEFLHVDLTAVASFFLVCCLFVPFLAFLFFRYQAYIFSVLIKILKIEQEK